MSEQPGRSFLRRHQYLLLFIALLFRGVYVGLEINEIRIPGTPGLLSVTTGDTKGYLGPIESVLAGGSYEPDYRMPGVGAPYWVFRHFLDAGSSRDAMVILQWLLAGISVYLLGRIAERFTGSGKIGLAVYALFLASAYASWFDASISSDSFSVSCLIIGTFFLQQAVDRKHHAMLLLAGVFLGWLVFLRPVNLVPLVIAAVLILRFAKWPRPLWALGLFLIPFVVADVPWAVRNWRADGKVNLLTNQGLLPAEFTGEVVGHAMVFLQGYGANYIWWAPGADIRWYGIWAGGEELDDQGREAKAPPDYAIVPGYTRDSLYLLSERVRRLEGGQLSATDSIAEVAAINARFDHYTELYKKGAPFNYHVLSRLRMLRNTMWQHGTEGMIYRPFNSLPWWMKGFKIFQSLMYIFTYVMGSIMTLLLIWNWRKASTLVHLWVPLFIAFTTLIYPIVLRMCEWRYMVHQFPFALLLAVVLSFRIVPAIRARSLAPILNFMAPPERG